MILITMKSTFQICHKIELTSEQDELQTWLEFICHIIVP